MEFDFLDDHVAVRDVLGLSRTEIILTPYSDTDNASIRRSIAPLGWHIQYRSTEQDLPELSERLLALPVDLVVDHIGNSARIGDGPSRVRRLLRMLETSRCWVKLSAAYQLSKMGAPDYSVIKHSRGR